MNQKRNRDSVKATSEGTKLLQEAKAKRDDEGNFLSYERLAHQANISTRTVRRFYNGKRVDRSSAIAIIKTLGLKEDEILDQQDSLVKSTIKEIQAKETEDSEPASELIKQLETELSKRQETEQDSFQAMAWLKANRRTLSREAAEAALRKHYEENSENINIDYLENIEEFSQEIRQYLKVIYSCLKVGSWDFIDKAMQENLMPIHRDIQLYVLALQFIKNKKISINFSPDEARELKLCLDYLIYVIPQRF